MIIDEQTEVRNRCASDYVRDTGGHSERGQRLVLCTLPTGHVGQHQEVDEGGEILVAWDSPRRMGEPKPGPSWDRPSTVFGVRSPWSGDERDPVPWTYWVWFRAYRWARIFRHGFGLHDRRWPSYRCDWCGEVARHG